MRDFLLCNQKEGYTSGEKEIAKNILLFANDPQTWELAHLASLPLRSLPHLQHSRPIPPQPGT